MKAFHSSIKYTLYSRYASNADLVIELAGGHANDLHRWIKYKIKNIVVVDKDIIEITEGQKRCSETHGCPNVRFILDDINEPQMVYSEKQANVVFCNFAIHYFLKSDVNIKSLKWIIDKYLLNNGYFIFMALDGQRVFDILRNGDAMFGDVCISKKYRDAQFKPFGQEIHVSGADKEYREYLVNFDFIKSVFNNYRVAEDRMFINTDGFKMSMNEERYSSLNRYIVLQKK